MSKVYVGIMVITAFISGYFIRQNRPQKCEQQSDEDEKVSNTVPAELDEEPERAIECCLWWRG